MESEFDFKKTDFAGGDSAENRDRSSNVLQIKTKPKSESKIRVIFDSKHRNIKDTKPNKSYHSFDTVTGFRNVNYCESNLSINGNSCNRDVINEKLSPQFVESNEESEEIQRPVPCPVTECAKMMAISSVLMHFYFDHPKVALLSTDRTMEIIINAYRITDGNHCIALLIQHDEKSEMSNKILHRNLSYSTLQQYKNVSQILLMGTRFSTLGKKVKPLTQNFIEDNKVIQNKKSQSQRDITNKTFKNSDVLIFWICKLKEITKLYSITATGGNERFSHSYSGEAVHIRENQYGASIYDRADCLMIRGAAINRLLNGKEELKLIVDVNDIN